MGENLGGWKRTDYCGNLGVSDVGREVVLMGWTQRRRDLGSLIFVWLRDRTGMVQVLFDDKFAQFEKAQAIRSEYVLAVRGEVVKRAPEAVNAKLKTGEIEVVAKELKILSEAETPPIYVEDDSTVSEALRLKYRYLDLRRPYMQNLFALRHKVGAAAREFLDANGFLYIETPMMGKSSPEGARDYLVPSRVHIGSFYALPQSPQLYKQLFMVSGFDRYYQIVKCFRDEDLRADRQPEFTQIDIEMSFVDADDVMGINERLVAHIFKTVLGREIKLPLKRLTYKEAMERYGSDKPDTRFGLELVPVSDIVKGSAYGIFANAVAKGGSVVAVNAEGAAGKISRKDVDALTEHVKTYRAKGLGFMAFEAEGGVRSPLAKFLTEDEISEIAKKTGAKPGDMLFFIADENWRTACEAAGQLRLELGRRLGLIDNDRFDLLWVTEFPLFEYDEEAGRLVAVHHPFTSPMDEDLPLLDTEPLAVRAKAYDIILNGTELGGGSIRIHDNKLQKKMFSLIGIDEQTAQENFGYLLEAFKYGPPPHGGIAYGFDRMCMLLSGASSIRDVIAFPKVQNASCPLTGAPAPVTEAQLGELGISVGGGVNEEQSGKA